MQNWDSTFDEDEYITNSIILELQEGDEIHLVLPRGMSVYDSWANGTTFSGALLFTLWGLKQTKQQQWSPKKAYTIIKCINHQSESLCAFWNCFQ